MPTGKQIKTISLFCALAWSLCVTNLNAQSEPFYKGKSIRIIVGLTPGGFMIAGPACSPAICRNTFLVIPRSSCKTCRAPGR